MYVYIYVYVYIYNAYPLAGAVCYMSPTRHPIAEGEWARGSEVAPAGRLAARRDQVRDRARPCTCTLGRGGVEPRNEKEIYRRFIIQRERHSNTCLRLHSSQKKNVGSSSKKSKIQG